MNQQNQSLPTEAILAIEQGKLIEAIRITRSNTGLGLKASKEAVEAYMVSNPSTNEKYQAVTSKKRKFFHKLVLVSTITLAALIAFLAFSEAF